MRSVRILLVVLAGCVLACAQPAIPTPTPVYNDFSYNVKGLTLGPTHCYFWSQLVEMLHVQIVCYYQNTIFFNSYQSVGLLFPNAFVVSAAIPSGNTKPDGTQLYNQLTWTLTPGPNPPRALTTSIGAPAPAAINFDMSIALWDGSMPMHHAGTF